MDTIIPPPVHDDDAFVSHRQAEELMAMHRIRESRAIEALRLYRPMPTQLPFHESMATERICRGGNGSGKTTSAALEVASAALDIPIMRADGTFIPRRYPKRPLKIWVIGYDEKHVGNTIYAALFKAGQFSIIRDLDTGDWRAVDPYRDSVRRDDWKPGPAFIPQRFIDQRGWGWSNKAIRSFDVCRLINGTEIHAYSSHGEPAQGVKVDIIWIDEDIEYDRHMPEWQARLSHTKGCIIWSAKPHSKNDALVDMHNRAEDQASREHPDTFEIVLRMRDNPFIDPDEKRKRLQEWSEEERRQRDDGDFLTDSFLMYPTFHMGLHGAPEKRLPGDDRPDSTFDRVLRETGQPPADWCRYMVVDPGTAVCAVLFAAVPPPGFGDHVLLYDELYLRNCDAERFGREVSQRAEGQTFQAFIIDEHGSRSKEAGSGRTVKDQYSAALKARNIYSVATGFGFVPGSDNREARAMQVRSWMGIREDGTTKLRVLHGRLPAYEREVKRYRRKMTAKGMIEDVAEPGSPYSHLQNCVEYLAAYAPKYVKPVPRKPVRNRIQAVLDRLHKQKKRDYVSLGPSPGV